MKLIQFGWKIAKNGRMTRVIKHNRPPVRVTNRMLTPAQTERREILIMLAKRRKEKEKEMKYKLIKTQESMEKNMKAKQKRYQYRHFCTACKRIKPIKNGVYDITSNGMLLIKGNCGTCDKRMSRMLRKANQEEMKAIGQPIQIIY